MSTRKCRTNAAPPQPSVAKLCSMGSAGVLSEEDREAFRLALASDEAFQKYLNDALVKDIIKAEEQGESLVVHGSMRVADILSSESMSEAAFDSFKSALKAAAENSKFNENAIDQIINKYSVLRPAE